MNAVCKDIFKAVHEGKWLSIEYKNKEETITRYWVGIKNIDVRNRTLDVDGLHLSKLTLTGLRIFIDSILSTAVIEGSYCKTNDRLLEDIKLNPHKYKSLFSHAANLKILNYLTECNRLDTTPYKCEYALIHCLDGECLSSEVYQLSSGQFKEIVDKFQYKSIAKTKSKKIKQLCLNILSVNSKKGLYVLAYKKLRLDVKSKTLKPSDEITICREFTINGEKQSIRQFLDAEDYALLDDFEKNQKVITDKIMEGNPYVSVVDDMPYLIAIGMDVILNLNREYKGILEMYNQDEVTAPIKAFFGDWLKQPERRKEYPIALLNRKVNLDQLLAINTAVKYPIVYVQGPPGTGKTNTIINTIITAFFNNKTVLFTSYNNHPIDGVFETLQKIGYKGYSVPFPALRLGNNEKMRDALEFIRQMYESTKKIRIFEGTLERNKDDKIERTKRLTALLRKHDEILELKERKETIERLLKSRSNDLTFLVELQGRQLQEVNERLAKIGEVRDEDALSLVADDTDEFKKYLYYISARYIKKLEEPKYKELIDIVYLSDKTQQITIFNSYLEDEDNMKKLLHVFPVIMTTCISAHKLSEPKPHFDMVIMDEASQCNTAVALVPIIRGKGLMLVGDPQQLSPVILLSPRDNEILKRNYGISGDYDYINNSIYKTYLACDSISDEILLSHHYRCNKRIIEFNNKKYYNGKLDIKSTSRSEKPLVYIDVENNKTNYKNTAPMEAEQIMKFAVLNKDKEIGIITPFTNQKEYINHLLKDNKVENVVCGTVHAFQGDEKDIILFSLAVTEQTHVKTYNWLKNNKELINVATSRAKEQLVIVSSSKILERLHSEGTTDDVYELVDYVKTNGTSQVSGKEVTSRALGIKPYSTQTEEAFLGNLNHAMDNILRNNRKCVIHKEVGIAHVFSENNTYNDLFYSGRFDFVVYEKGIRKEEIPIFAIELDGKEHVEEATVRERDRKKNEICRAHGFELIRIENSYARRYNHVKDILIHYFAKLRVI